MENGWQSSADAWIADMGERGDFGRRYVLDPVMLSRAVAGSPRNALDVGCGEGRFCRMLKSHGVDVVGLDPTPALIAAARTRDVRGAYLKARAECLPFRDGRSVLSWLSRSSHPGRQPCGMARVLKRRHTHRQSRASARADSGWIKDSGGDVSYPIDNYLQEHAMWIEYRGIRVVNHHRPLSTYLRALLGTGLVLTHFDEPAPTPDAPASRANGYARAPWFLVMEWLKPALPSTRRATGSGPCAHPSR
jgi:SAM-dependent methyltransferase